MLYFTDALAQPQVITGEREKEIHSEEERDTQRWIDTQRKRDTHREGERVIYRRREREIQ